MSKAHKKSSGVFWAVLVLWAGFAVPAWSANQNPLAVYIDELDDDLRLLTTCLLDPSLRARLRLIVVSTGDAGLKAKVVQRVADGLGPGHRIEIVEGTSTDLSRHPTTAFAADISKEGGSLVKDSERKPASVVGLPSGLLESAQAEFQRQEFQDSPFLRSGDAPSKPSHKPSEAAALALVKVLSALGDHQKLDVLLATSPVDLVAGIKANRPLASVKLGDLFAMGLFKTVAHPVTGEISFAATPFNAVADWPFLSTSELLALYNDHGVFQRFFHVPSDTVRERSGLLGGYPDKMSAFADEVAALREKMESHPVLHLILRAANAYRMHWFEFLGRYGHGLLEGEQWIRDSIQDMTLGGAAGFYIADPSLAYLASQDETSVAQWKKKDVRVSATISPTGSALSYGFEKKGRVISDIRSIDGAAVVRHHIKAVMSAPAFTAPPNGFDYLEALKKAQDTSLDQPIRYALASVASHLAGPLVVVFKNSPDDYFAVLTLLSAPAARQALRRGGIICEGFAPELVADALRRALADIGETEVPIVAGFAYSHADVLPHRNFGGERVLYGAGAGTEAFGSLAKASNRFPSITNAPALLVAAQSNASRLQQQMVLLVLGGGLDIFRHLEKNPAFALQVRAAYLMQGGRPREPGSETLEPTRNLRVLPDLIYDGVDRLIAAGVEVDLFSSDVFGSNVSVQLDAAGNAFHGSMRDVYNFMRQTETGSQTTGFGAVMRHWRNWGIAYEKPFLIDGHKYDPLYSVDTLKTSLLAVYMSRALVEGRLNLGPVKIEVSKVDLRNRMGAGRSRMRVNWLNQVQGSVDTDAMAAQLLASVVQLQDARVMMHADPVKTCARDLVENYYESVAQKVR